MSTILRALKKSEQQRDRGAVPTLARVPDPTPRDRRLWPWWLGGALALNAAALAALVWWLGQSPEPGEAAGGTATAAPAAPDIAAQTAPPEPRAAESGGEKAAPPPTASLAKSEAEEAVPAPTVASAPALALRQPAAALPDLPPPVEVRVAVVVPPEAPLREPEPEPDPYAALPLLLQLPYSIQAAIPALPVSVHVYDADAGNRFIIIERRKYREGDELGDDLILEGIAPRGLVLRYQDTAFRLDL